MLKRRLAKIKHDAWVQKLVASSRRRYGHPSGPVNSLPDLTVDNPPGLAPTSDRMGSGTKHRKLDDPTLIRAIKEKMSGIELAYNKGPYMYKPRGE